MEATSATMETASSTTVEASTSAAVTASMLSEGRRTHKGRKSDACEKSLEQGGRFHRILVTLTVGGTRSARERQAASSTLI